MLPLAYQHKRAFLIRDYPGLLKNFETLALTTFGVELSSTEGCRMLEKVLCADPVVSVFGLLSHASTVNQGLAFTHK